MTYLVEINDKTLAGRKALSYLQKLQLQEPAIRITQKKNAFRKLTTEEMVIPGGEKFTGKQLDEWLDRKDTGKPMALAQLRKKMEKRYSKKVK
jgi:2-succinyl-5-enolpyruvyl-6-hydroxy-3-cyclohexene-1-carboxylate synthase